MAEAAPCIFAHIQALTFSFLAPLHRHLCSFMMATEQGALCSRKDLICNSEQSSHSFLISLQAASKLQVAHGAENALQSSLANLATEG